MSGFEREIQREILFFSVSLIAFTLGACFRCQVNLSSFVGEGLLLLEGLR